MRSRIGSGKDQEYVVALLFVISFGLQDPFSSLRQPFIQPKYPRK